MYDCIESPVITVHLLYSLLITKTNEAGAFTTFVPIFLNRFNLRMAFFELHT